LQQSVSKKHSKDRNINHILKRASSFDTDPRIQINGHHLRTYSEPQIALEPTVNYTQGSSRDISLPAIMSEPQCESSFKLPPVNSLLSAPHYETSSKHIFEETCERKETPREPQSIDGRVHAPVDVANILASFGRR
jgi:hypothetical protein